MKQCTRCKEVKDDSCFHKDRNAKTGLYSHCKQCKRKSNERRWKEEREHLQEQNRKSRAKRAAFLRSLKTPCVKCGENRHYLIQFHHINPNEKEFVVAQFSTHGMQHMEEEAKKCICLCANCHAEFHWMYGQKPENPDKALEEYLGYRP